MEDEGPQRTYRPVVQPRGSLLPREIHKNFVSVVRNALTAAQVCSELDPDVLKPAIACAEGLVDQARDVLEGNPLATETFRTTLSSFGGALVPTPIGVWVITVEHNTTKPRKRKRMRLSKAQSGAPQLVSIETLELVLTAAVYASRTPAELAIHLGGLQLALQGVDEMQHLYDVALRSDIGADFSNAFDSAVRAMSWTPETTGRLGMPGTPFAPPGRSPWFDWPPLPSNPTPELPVPRAPPLPAEIPRGIRLTDYFERCLTNDLIPELHRRGIGFLDLITSSSGAYQITDISPQLVCPGSVIVIDGSNFTGATEVRFVTDRGERVSATPASVTDDRIEVTVPDDARTGPVWIYIPITVRLCLTESTMARPGHPGEIEIGIPIIHEFGLPYGQDCIDPGLTAVLNWSVSPDTAEVTIAQYFPSGARTELVTAGPASGTLSLAFGTPGTWRYELEATDPALGCDAATASRTVTVSRRGSANFEIAGIEHTQAIQVFSLTDPPPEPNNSIDLIAGMDTVVRVYLRTLPSGASGWLARCTGTLEMDGVTYPPINENPAGVAHPFIEAATDPLRTNTNDSLNFLIPAADCTGANRAARIEVFSTGACGSFTQRQTERLTWLDRPPLPVTIRRIAESDAARTVISAADALDLVMEAFRRMPSPRTDIRMHPGVHQLRAGTTEDNYCTDGGFYQLALSIAYEHNDNEGYPPEPHGTSWIGLFSGSGCNHSGMMAWPSTSSCISQLDEETVAHELMHTVGLGHTKTTVGENCESVFQPVACHILRDSTGADTNGRLLHVPFDISNNRAVTGAVDLQSYRTGPRWLNAGLWELGRTLMDTRY